MAEQKPTVPAVQNIADLSQQFEIAGNGTDDAFQRFTSKSIPEFYASLTKGLPTNTHVQIVFNAQNDVTGITIAAPKSFAFFRNFDMRTKTAYHTSAEVYDVKGQGISKQINKNMAELYADIGIEKIDINTSKIGIYAWGRVGFVPDYADWKKLSREIERRLQFLEENPSEKDGALPASYVDTLKQALKSHDPKMFWFIVDQEYSYGDTTIGKALTLPLTEMSPLFPYEKTRYEQLSDQVGWHGRLDLTDPDCKQRMDHYLGNDPSPAPQLKTQITAKNKGATP